MTNALFSDISDALSMRTLIFYRSVMEVKARYKRTLIGPFWTSLSMGIFIVSFSLIGSKLWKNDVASFMPFFCAGYLVWVLISTIITESRTIFIVNRDILLSTPVPLSIFVFELVIRNLIVFTHHLLVYALVLAFCGYNPGWHVVFMIPGLAIIFTASFLFSVIWSIACTRYQDLSQLSQNLLQIIFFLTPIMWPVEQLSGDGRHWIADINPAYHFIEIMRAPMLGHLPSALNYQVTIGTCVIFLVLALHSFSKFKHRIVFWI